MQTLCIFQGSDNWHKKYIKVHKTLLYNKKKGNLNFKVGNLEIDGGHFVSENLLMLFSTFYEL